MSWLFGVQKNAAPQIPDDFQASGPPGGPQQPGGQPPKSEGNSKMAYSFDSTALERAAKAARDLERFPNAKEALELSRMQEVTRQKEVENETKKIEAQLANMKSEHIRVAEEERRKTLGEETKHARSVSDYSDNMSLTEYLSAPSTKINWPERETKRSWR